MVKKNRKKKHRAIFGKTLSNVVSEVEVGHVKQQSSLDITQVQIQNGIHPQLIHTHIICI